MVENAGIKDLDLINQTRDNIHISHFYPEELSKYRETTVICDIACLFAKHSEFEWRECNC